MEEVAALPILSNLPVYKGTEEELESWGTQEGFTGKKSHLTYPQCGALPRNQPSSKADSLPPTLIARFNSARASAPSG